MGNPNRLQPNGQNFRAESSTNVQSTNTRMMPNQEYVLLKMNANGLPEAVAVDDRMLRRFQRSLTRKPPKSQSRR